jgi:hypothetical protein
VQLQSACRHFLAGAARQSACRARARAAAAGAP